MPNEYIEREAALTVLQQPHDRVRKMMAIPAANVVEVDVKDFWMKRAIRTLCKYYSEAKKSNYVKKPIAWALYQTWKTVDVTCGESKEGDGDG